ncbi:hypothetical protein BCV70DRAFT_115610 [Testicularia cyperi]|uniref:Extracellular membrane protein CFEM domain-containing protein n=1 Tax=Testicularia cyperi TaxID=1882483 RepID=A0A317XN89_9BASI|nr:hypothetical protein BCV70DRAFT_115610 [Testicularia cyperi]
MQLFTITVLALSMVGYALGQGGSSASGCSSDKCNVACTITFAPNSDATSSGCPSGVQCCATNEMGSFTSPMQGYCKGTVSDDVIDPTACF